jgi:hypothetical protein
MMRFIAPGALFAATVFFILAVSAHVGDPSGIERLFMANIGGVGLQVGVLPNPENTAAEQLKLEEDRIRNRERLLLLREADAMRREDTESRSTIYVALGEAILFCLILANFYLDRRERAHAGPPRGPLAAPTA